MKNYFKLLANVLNYKKQAAVNIFFNILSVFFSLFSLTMIVPFLNVLFSQDMNAYQKVPWSLSISTLLANFNYFIAQNILKEGQLATLSFIVMLVIVMFFLKNFFKYAAMYFMGAIRTGIVRDLRNRMYSKILQLPLSYFSDERKGDIMVRMSNDVQEVEWSIMQSLEVIFREPLTIILFLITLFLMSPQLTVFVLVLLPVAGFLISLISKSLRRTSVKMQSQLGVLISTIEETLSSLRIIKGFNAETSSNQKFQSINERYKVLQLRALRKKDLSSPLSEFLGVIVMAVVMYFGGKLVLSEDHLLSPSSFIAYIAIFSQLIPPAKAFTEAYANIQKGIASLERMNKILDADLLISDKKDAQTLPAFSDSIEYKNVSFAYRKGDNGWVLKDINLKVEKGKTIALVGQSGSGKTTLADLLPRFYDTDKGSLTIDGYDVKNCTMESIRKQMGIVTQESILFNDTVFNNIAFGKVEADIEQVMAAAKIANAHDFISALPEGYYTNIGDRGGKLSGGQRQRLSIARAVLKNPPILILDEATSALDTESEKLVQDALQNLMRERTSIVIAHRLSTIQHADEIVVMQSGEIVERGKHAELLMANGVYRKLYDLQSFV